jgi:hypothetical protein
MRLGSKPLAAVALAAALTPTASAADLFGKEALDITPFYGYRIGGHLVGVADVVEYPFDGAASFGVVSDINLKTDNFKIELLWSHQKTGFQGILTRDPQRVRLNIDHIQAGIMQEVGKPSARFAIALLVGTSRMDSPGLGSEFKFSASIGGNLKFFLSEHVGLRFDARAYAMFVNTSGGAFCASGHCLFTFSGSTMWQGDFTGGLLLAF